ncbi:hypothetical protein [Sphingobacterium sp. UBA6645]|uniref:hypothetical protein n=1 Tax=Sphingobacterium sp. UBA6645 TaxID=1947511 RepID=UPI0025F843CE|nr:hypothetical protein [Sphingobacterium sp. UBA6645]
MKLKLLKDHELGKANDVVEVTDKMGNYLVRCKVGVEHVEAPRDVKPKKAKKNGK